jgi:hypothetical protein
VTFEGVAVHHLEDARHGVVIEEIRRGQLPVVAHPFLEPELDAVVTYNSSA